MLDFISTSIPEIFEKEVLLNPDKIAIVNGATTFTYGNLNQNSNKLAHYLMSQKEFKKGSVIAIYADSSEWSIICMIAILKLGCIYLPLDSKYPEENIKYMIQNSGTSAILIENKFLEEIHIATIPVILIEGLENKIETYSAINPKLISTPDDAAYIMFTSGTTGTPNGVVIPQKGIIRLVNSDYIPFKDELTFMQLAPLGFDASTFEIWGALLHGNKLVIYSYHLPEFIMIQEFIQVYGVTCLWLTSALFNAIIDESPEILKGIKYLLTGGDQLSVSHIKKAQHKLLDTTFINGYGPTECTTFACCYTIPFLNEKNINFIPIGKPIRATSVYLLDKKLNPVPDGVTGELFIGGDGLAIEYLNNTELTRNRFINYHIDENKVIRLYKTGDLCQKNKEGFIDFIGRIDHQVKINGFRIETAEIEICLKNYPDISDAVVLVKHTGEHKKLIAYIVAKTESMSVPVESMEISTVNNLDKDALKQYLKKWLPTYMVPGTILEVKRFPLNTNGKIDRTALLNVVTKEVKLKSIDKFEGIDEEIRLICENILSVQINTKNENFFKLGGESLSIAQLLFHIGQEYHVIIPINYFYNEPTLSTILKIIKNEETEEFDLINSRLKKAGEIFENNSITDLSKLENEYSLIQIKKGKGDPLFIAPGLFGNVFSFVEFVNKINIHNPVYIFEYPINKEGRFVATDMNELAKYFTYNLLKSNFEGNFHLLGYSFGGRLMFEIAHQFELANRKISFLGIIDSEGVDTKYLTNKNQILYEFHIFRKLPFKLKIKYLNYRIFRKITDKLKANIITTTEQIKTQIQKQKILEDDFYRIWYSFNPDYRLNTDLFLFKANNEDPQWLLYYVKYLYPDLYFKNNLNGNLFIQEINCDHMGFFKPLNLIKLTNSIENIIQYKH